MKVVLKSINPSREASALADSKKSGFPVAFGDKELFSTLQVTIRIESRDQTRIFRIAKEHLPNNKTNTTRFRLVETQMGVDIKWCSKVATNMKEI